MKKERIAVAYIRVSTNRQREEGTSLASQKERIESYCANNNILLKEIFSDQESAKDFNRNGYQKALKYIKENKPEINLLIATNIDRFSRHVAKGLTEIEQLEKIGVEVNFTEEWNDSINSPSSKLMTNFKMGFAEYERNKIGERTKLGIETALRQGRYTYTPPKGYSKQKLVSDNPYANGKIGLVPNEDAKLIKQLFIDFSTGEYLQKEIIAKYKSKGLKLSKSTLSKLLSNILYIGKLDLSNYDVSENDIIDAVHQPIVPTDVFYKVQDIKNGRNNKVKTTRPKNEKFPLSGFVYCTKCDSPFYGSTSSNGKKKNKKYYDYYSCKNNCLHQSYRAEYVHDRFKDLLRLIRPSKGVIELYKEVLKTEYENALDQAKKSKKEVKKEIKKLEEKLTKLTDKYIDDDITKDAYDLSSSKITRELQEFKSSLKNLDSNTDGLTSLIDFGLSFLGNLYKSYDSAPRAIKEKLLGSYFKEHLYFGNGKFRTPKFNDFILLICGKNKELHTEIKKTETDFGINSRLVPWAGIEPALPKELDFESL
ncbi:MAG: recombinase family protein [Flavobacteriales bacterium]|jgi:DNA invertase Pin-like site-specific DNA recombinase|nr:recombinase family protein [Flavobacteriales bacterium]